MSYRQYTLIWALNKAYQLSICLQLRGHFVIFRRPFALVSSFSGQFRYQFLRNPSGFLVLLHILSFRLRIRQIGQEFVLYTENSAILLLLWWIRLILSYYFFPYDLNYGFPNYLGNPLLCVPLLGNIFTILKPVQDGLKYSLLK